MGRFKISRSVRVESGVRTHTGVRVRIDVRTKTTVRGERLDARARLSPRESLWRLPDARRHTALRWRAAGQSPLDAVFHAAVCRLPGTAWQGGIL